MGFPKVNLGDIRLFGISWVTDPCRSRTMCFQWGMVNGYNNTYKKIGDFSCDGFSHIRSRLTFDNESMDHPLFKGTILSSFSTSDLWFLG